MENNNLEPSDKGTLCSICGRLFDFESETDDEDYTGETWHNGAHDGLIPVLHFDYSEETILRCLECKTFFYYHTFTPGGSYDAMKTIHIERFRRLTLPEAIDEIKSIGFESQKLADNMLFVCDVRTVQSQVQNILSEIDH